MKIEEWCKPEDQTASVGCHSWNVARLHQLAAKLPEFDAPIHCLNLWTKYEVTLRDMLMHIRAVENADLNYPIILDEDGVIMDGRHRIMKAILNGMTTIKAVRFDKNPAPCKIED